MPTLPRNAPAASPLGQPLPRSWLPHPWRLRARLLLRAAPCPGAVRDGRFASRPARLRATGPPSRRRALRLPSGHACGLHAGRGRGDALCSRRPQPPSGDNDKHCRRLGGIGAARARGGAALRWLLVVPRPSPSGAVAPPPRYRCPSRGGGSFPRVPPLRGRGRLGRAQGSLFRLRAVCGQGRGCRAGWRGDPRPAPLSPRSWGCRALRSPLLPPRPPAPRPLRSPAPLGRRGRSRERGSPSSFASRPPACPVPGLRPRARLGAVLACGLLLACALDSRPPPPSLSSFWRLRRALGASPPPGALSAPALWGLKISNTLVFSPNPRLIKVSKSATKPTSKGTHSRALCVPACCRRAQVGFFPLKL